MVWVTYMANRTELQNTFTSQDAVALFKEHTGFEFHPTVPGQLLARCGVEKIPSKSKPSRFDATNWTLVWEEMFHLALRRCRFDRKLLPPKKCFAPVLLLLEDPHPASGKRHVPPRHSPAFNAEAPPQEQESPAKMAIRAALEAARQAVKAHSRNLERKPHPELQGADRLTPEKGEEKNLAPVLARPQLSKPPVAAQETGAAKIKQDISIATRQACDLKPHPTRQFLEVPFEEKDEAKWRGAKWDWTFRKWYVPSGLNRKLFHWPDALFPPAMRVVEFPPDEPSVPSKSRVRKKKAGASSKSTGVGKRLQKELNGRLQFLLEKPD
jgi:hypothetical protein